jgi:hypothetical protein
MRIENAFEVRASPEAAWVLLSDVPRVVPCMPGAELGRTLDERTWEVFQQVKLGPISLRLRSEVTQAELREADRRAILAVRAKEVRGRGGAEATIESRLEPTATGTRVRLVTELSLQGVVAQYGRPVVDTVLEELTRQFAACLASVLEQEGSPVQPQKPLGGFGLLLGMLRRRLFRRREG